ncbi:MAG: hypothetical protein KAY37_00900 [Phycisphaerae bacterium]|nr:hypothetical protein [Phycisphaerae bacterium]
MKKATRQQATGTEGAGASPSLPRCLVASLPSSWHNHLPGWIREDPVWRDLRSTPRRILQALADACDPPNSEGSLLGAVGGAGLLAAIGCGRGTLFRHLPRLETAGFVVCLEVGGCRAGQMRGNVYGIPGRRGGLDPLIIPGRQRPLWREQRDTTRCCALQNGARSKMERAPKWSALQNEAPPSYGLYGKKDHGHGGSKGQDSGWKGAFQKILPAQLRDTGRLLKLYRVAVRRGWVADSPDGRIKFVTAAEHALRLGDNPGAYFVGLIKNQRYLLPARDEDAAVARLCEYDGDREGGRQPGNQATRQPGRESGLAPDARALLKLRAACRRAGYDQAYLRRELKQQGWDEERYHRAAEDLKE